MKNAILLIMVLLSTGISGRAEQKARERKIIEFGWDEPDTRFLREHHSQIERSPFDGCVFHVDAYDSTGKPTGSLTWQGWGSRTFNPTELERAKKDLEVMVRLRGRRMSHFLRFNTTPARLDWFDGFDSVLQNAKLAAGLARAGGCAGILLDTEQYEGQLFDYSKQRNAKSITWERYGEQARQRGREVMRAFQSEFPGLRVLLTFGYSLPWSEMHRNQEQPLALSKVPSGLLAPFLDGLYSEARGGSRIIDGYELSYGYLSRRQFELARESMKKALLPIVGDVVAYQNHGGVAFGLWLDHDWRSKGWSETDLSRNHFSPERLANSLNFALELTDEYVWIYTEQPRWWSAQGNSVKLPKAYQDVVRRRKPR